MNWKSKPLRRKAGWSLQTKMIILVLVVVIVVLLVTNLLIGRNISKYTQQNLSLKVTDIARMVAHSDIVIDGMTGKRPERDIQTYASQTMELTGVGYVVVLDMNLIRKSHPDPKAIGHSFLDRKDAARSLLGEEYVSIAKGVLGKSQRAFTPVRDADGKQVGVVVVGIYLDKIMQEVRSSQFMVTAGIIIGLTAGLIGAFLLARHIKKILFGMEPSQIAQLLEERGAMLHSVDEGVFAVNRSGALTLVNSKAMDLLGEKAEFLLGKKIDSYSTQTIFEQVLEDGNPELNVEQNIKGVTVLANYVPVRVNGEVVGALATFKDLTEVKKLAEQLTGVQHYSDALRAQSHEFMNKLQVISGMVHMGSYKELDQYIQQTTGQHQSEVGFIVRRIKDPVFAGFLLGKFSSAREDGVEFLVSEESYLPEPKDPDILHDLIKITGNLINNAIEALQECDKKQVIVTLQYDCGWLLIEVKDSGKGIPREIRENIFTKGFSTKGENRGLGLFFVQQTVMELQGNIELRTVVGRGTSIQVKIPYEAKGDEV
ncbi:DcuS/MalK family sensor histidine kinase [Paenibacillus caui]|uniref:DcuS/MalK family sensor histidine kinase n=1 Tax=Paenibacillus caui TaxID=2873927 RepID=UPI001CA8C625|nr:DcuS/MalK family sensor histidine kinase [Paenibacillus caui]